MPKNLGDEKNSFLIPYLFFKYYQSYSRFLFVSDSILRNSSSLRRGYSVLLLYPACCLHLLLPKRKMFFETLPDTLPPLFRSARSLRFGLNPSKYRLVRKSSRKSVCSLLTSSFLRIFTPFGPIFVSNLGFHRRKNNSEPM